MSDQPVNNQPSFAELAAALKSLERTEPQGLNKHVTTIVVAASLGIGAWVLSGLNSVENTLARVDATMTSVQTTTTDTSRQVATLTSQQADLKAQQAIDEQRIAALETSHRSQTIEQR